MSDTVRLLYKLKSARADGKMVDYSAVDDAPIIEADLTVATLTANTYYKHTGTTGTYTTGVIYYYNGSSLKPIDGSGYTLPSATSTALGGIKIGYTASGANLPVALSSEKAYVAVTKTAVTTALGYTPPESNTDTKVTQTKTTSASSMPLLLAPAGQTATTTTTANFTNNIYAVPSTGRLYVTGGSNPLFGLQATNGTAFFLQAQTDKLFLGPTSAKALTFTGSTGAISMPNNLTVTGTISEGGTTLANKYLGVSSVSVTQKLTSGTEIGSVTVNGTATKLYAPNGGLGSQEVEDIVDGRLEYYVQTQALEEGLVDLSEYGFASATNLSGVAVDVQRNTDRFQDLSQGLFDLSTYNFATEAYVSTAISDLVDSSPETLNTLNELAAALGDDPNFATTMATELGKKQNTITGAATTITSSNLTASRALVSDANGKVAVSAVTSTELGYLDGVTSAIQTQLNGKLSTTGKAASAKVADSANAVAWSKVSSKPTFATVATSGSYNDLSNKPTIPAAVSVTQKLTSGTEIGSVTIGSTTTKLYAPTATSVDLSGYLPLSGGTIKGNILFSNSNAQGAQPNLKWKTINSKTPYVGYCTASADGTFLVASLGGTSYTTGLSIGGSSGNLLWKGTRVATTADIPSLSNYSTLANTIKALKISGKTITYTKGDGTTGTLTTQDTVYSLPTAGKDTLGGVKTTSTVTSASGYTACPIIGGVPYYKDTATSDGKLRQYYDVNNPQEKHPILFSYDPQSSDSNSEYKSEYGAVNDKFTIEPERGVLNVGDICISDYSYGIYNRANPDNNIYLGDDIIGIYGSGIDIGGDTTIVGQGNVSVAVGENDEASIQMYTNGGGGGTVDISANEIHLSGYVTVNGEPIGSGGGGNTKTPYATSSTSSTVVAKVATISSNADNFSLAVGQRVAVKFTYSSTAANPTLNVNGTGAKAIYGWDYTAITATEGWGAGDICEFMYNGTYWIWMNDMPYAAKSTSSGTKTGTKGAVRIRVYNGNLYIHTS